MEFRSGSLDFSSPLQGSGPRTVPQTVLFPRQVRAATAGITGYLAEYSGGNDHHVGRLEIRLDTTIAADTVTVTGTFGVRDWSGNWDDAYDGNIGFAVIAELEPVTSLPPRGDLTITGMELNQAAQYFRSDRFLDGANIRPDNSIFLIERKNTGVRVYVDWDSSAGLPPIAHLSGELVVTSGQTRVTLTPINPGGSIVPKHDSNINQALANDTLNFMIPGALSVGTVDVRCEVFDQANPGSRSAAFERTLVFVPVAPLNIFTVGVATADPGTAAPTQAQIASSIASFLTKTYPRGTINITGFTMITDTNAFGGGSAPSSGCGGAWDNVTDQLQDLRGGSDDVYFGGLPSGVACSAIVLGCSPVGNGVGAAFVDLPSAVAHEIGHALGRKHPPCAGCSPPAQNTDSNFPQYDGFNSDSIGVFGFDPTLNAVFNPAATLDFMSAFISLGCSGSTVTSTAPRWISPYTHQGLLGALDGPAPGGGLRNRNVDVETLFIGLEIARDRTVARRYSFHYPAPLQGSAACATQFTYEFLDEKRCVLDCGPLRCRCAGGGCECWPKVIRGALPFPPGVRYFLVWEGDKMIYEEEVPLPPAVRITSAERQGNNVLLTWDSDSTSGLWYVVHWFDERHRVFRGVAPRTQERSISIPASLGGSVLRVRVYASSGIATGYAETEVRKPAQSGGRATVVLRGEPPSETPRASPVIGVMVTDASGKTVSDDLIAWYDAGGAEIARGSELDLRRLAPGRQVVRAVASRYGANAVGKSWLVERTPSGAIVHHVVCDLPISSHLDDHPHPHPAPPPCD
jgi:hypothetical protein